MRTNALIHLLIITTVAFILTATTPAQDATNQLKKLTEELAAKPESASLREQIIKLAATMKPPPAIPEKAREYFVEGSTLIKAAKDRAGQKLAVESFQNSVNAAPWWGDAYYNLAVAQELAGSFADAQSSLKFYILTEPGEKEARQAQDKIYALNAKKKLAEAELQVAAQKQVASAKASEPSPLERLNGVRFILYNQKTGMGVGDLFFEIAGDRLRRGHVDHASGRTIWGANQHVYKGDLQWEEPYSNSCWAQQPGCFASSYIVSPDGQSLRARWWRPIDGAVMDQTYRRVN